MAAAKAHVFGPLPSNFVDRQEMAQHYTRQRVPDDGESALCLDERMSTSACVFSRFESRSHNMDAVAKEPAPIVNFLLESIIPGIRVAGQLEKQRVSTSFTDVFIMARALGNRDVMMPAEKAGKRVGNSGNAVAPFKNGGATASATRVRVSGDSGVVDFMAEERA
jgi:hypothetical protein